MTKLAKSNRKHNTSVLSNAAAVSNSLASLLLSPPHLFRPEVKAVLEKKQTVQNQTPDAKPPVKDSCSQHHFLTEVMPNQLVHVRAQLLPETLKDLRI